MTISQSQHGLELPESLRLQLIEFRRRVWTIKMVEAACGAVTAVFAAFLATFALDRVWDTPVVVRTILFASAVFACLLVPLAMHRWVWRHRRFEQLARLLSRKHASVGDQLLGIIELVESESEQARSRELCAAAIQQVAASAQQRDFRDSVPNPRHRRRAVSAAAAAALVMTLLAVVPAAATNAWARLLAPWRNTPRYTFAAVEPLPDRIVVAHGEPFTVTVRLAESTAWRPLKGA